MVDNYLLSWRFGPGLAFSRGEYKIINYPYQVNGGRNDEDSVPRITFL